MARKTAFCWEKWVQILANHIAQTVKTQQLYVYNDAIRWKAIFPVLTLIKDNNQLFAPQKQIVENRCRSF